MSKRLTKMQMLTSLVQLLSVLVYLHARGIVHSDHKQDNNLFLNAGSDNLKLIDFVLSKTVLATGAFF
jgi:serine/threonine protein kinase